MRIVAWIAGSGFGRRVGTVLSMAAMLVASVAPTPALAQGNVSGYQPVEWAKIVAAAKKEGKVVFYLAQPVLDRIGPAFRKAYPDIALEAQRGVSAVLLGKVEQERVSGADGADLYATTEIAWMVGLSRQGLVLRPSGPGLEGYPAQHLLDGTVVTLAREPAVMLYNKNLVSIPPKTYADMLRPEFKGKIGTSELAATLLIAWYDWLEKNQGADYLTKLRAQNPKLYNGSVPLGQAVASGELAVSAFGIPTATAGLIGQGAPIAMVIPNPAFGSSHAVVAFKWAKRPNAALVLVDWLMSAEGQSVWVGQSETASPRSGIPRSLDFNAIIPWDPNAYSPELVKNYRDKWSKIFK